MAVAAPVSAPLMSTPFSGSRWIISRRQDLAFIIGSSLAGYLYVVLFAVVQVPVSYLWWFWSLGFDGTHIFATASRTYFDAEERRRNRKLLFGSLVVFFSMGPVLVLAGMKLLLAVFVGAWAYYHVVRQHYGFAMLYKVKNRDLAPEDNRLDRWFLGLMMIAPPFHRFFVHQPRELGLPAHIALDVVAPWFEPLMWSGLATITILYGRRLWNQRKAGQPWNVPKLLLLASIIPLHWITFATMSWQAAVPTVTIVHNLQYHALVVFYNRNKYGQVLNDGQREEGGQHGRIPSWVGSSLLIYAGLALTFSLAYRVPGYQFGQISDVAFGLFCGFGLTHYYLDSKIWRVRHDPGLREALRLS
jgi:hypothetical protein